MCSVLRKSEPRSAVTFSPRWLRKRTRQRIPKIEMAQLVMAVIAAPVGRDHSREGALHKPKPRVATKVPEECHGPPVGRARARPLGRAREDDVYPVSASGRGSIPVPGTRPRE